LTVTGLVRDRDTHAPLPGMWISRRWNPLTNLEKIGEMIVTDEQGRFAISGLNPEIVKWKNSHRDVTAFPPPGMPYHMAQGKIDDDGEVLIECVRGMPYRLKVVDERGEPVEADVTYQYVNPNPHRVDVLGPLAESGGVNRAARRTDGTYEGIAMPGPGAVLVKTPGRGYRPSHVDPKAFFAPGRTEWSRMEQRLAFGTHDTVATTGSRDQNEYAAIVLVNPPAPENAAETPTLELTATVFDDKPRRVSLVDADGQPVVGVKPHGMLATSGNEPVLRTASISLTKLHPDRIRRVIFVKEDRKLIGFLMARGDGDAPYAVVMQPWGTVRGRLVDAEGQPMDARLSIGSGYGPPNPDPEAGDHAKVKIDKQGQFQIDQLVPGQRYSARVIRGHYTFAGMAFENLVVKPGETRDLGDVTVKPPGVAKNFNLRAPGCAGGLLFLTAAAIGPSARAGGFYSSLEFSR
jgi:hypothetical protein